MLLLIEELINGRCLCIFLLIYLSKNKQIGCKLSLNANSLCLVSAISSLSKWLEREEISKGRITRMMKCALLLQEGTKASI